MNYQNKTSMKNLILTFFIIFASFLNIQAQEETFNLTIQITGLETDKGKVFLALSDRAESFLKKGEGTKGANAVVQNKKATIFFKGLKKGNYAVSFFHDENDNKIMDTKIFGIPKEPYGFSNNAKGFMGPPSFDDAKFVLDTNKTIFITVD